ncbi:hypothetical protein FGG08_007377 [Glutinoglossum americanum]|uniref:Uncharacterized protein n=1 Tax=Glutinoglossum americanum TaxID=1670608 RepID=A0A9P8KZE5_9PEZI|nr:hypothetical protein FGG08_007377 [Glutinoglossum americanum]
MAVLIGLFSLPSLGFKAKIFALVHLIGNPIDTIWSLLYKLAVCQERARKYKGQDRYEGSWKGMALLSVSHDEIEEGGGELPELRLCELVGDGKASYLAADRATKLLPVIVAEIIFITAMATAFVKISTSPPDPRNPTTVETHSFAFALLSLWIIPAVFLSSVIGVSQTEGSIPRILGANRVDTDMRIRNGGIYSWQPGKWPFQAGNGGGTQAKYRRFLGPAALASVSIGLAGAILTSSLSPPTGWGCRQCAQASVFLVYLLSASLDIPIERSRAEVRFQWAFVKDSVACLASVSTFLVVRLGIFNRCSCWTRFGRAGLALPQDPTVAEAGADLTRYHFPIIIGVSIALQVIFCILVGVLFRDAIGAFMQEDDNESGWLAEFSDWLRQLPQHLRVQRPLPGENHPPPVEALELRRRTGSGLSHGSRIPR